MQAPGARALEANDLVRGVESLVSKLADPDLPMDLRAITRLERALYMGHTANLLRLAAIELGVKIENEGDDA